MMFFSPPGFSQGLVIDHTCTDLTQIPAYWINQAKNLQLHYAHTSHGSQIITGIETLEGIDSTYAVSIGYSYLPSTAGALCIFDGQESDTYIEPGEYWETTGGLNYTRAVLNNNPGIDYSMWSWCGQVSYYSSTQIQNYLNALNQLESEYPGKRFIYMTGHLDGTGSSGTLHQQNEDIRQYCLNNNKILFDFADIERYDPDGTDYLDQGGGTGGDGDGCQYDSGNWGVEWCAAHSGSDRCVSCSCAHSQALNCNLKGRAFWWMMARLAGWNGTAAAATPTPVPGLPTPTPVQSGPTPAVSPASGSVIESGDYNGDGAADISVFRPASGLWSVRGITRVYFGGSSDLAVPADYSGDGSTDIAVYRPGAALWAIRGLSRVYFGTAADIPVPADYSGDGSADIGIFRSASGLWAVRGLTRVYFGTGGDRPVAGRYMFESARKYIAVFRPSSGLWAIRGLTRCYFGGAGDEPVPGDYGGWDYWFPAVYRPSIGLWAIRAEATLRYYFGDSRDRPVPANYNADPDSIDEIGTFRPSSGLWAIRGISRIYFGADTDNPVVR